VRINNAAIFHAAKAAQVDPQVKNLAQKHGIHLFALDFFALERSRHANQNTGANPGYVAGPGSRRLKASVLSGPGRSK
jgi:hypothetical protein